MRNRILTVVVLFMVAFAVIGWRNSIVDNGIYGETVLDTDTTTKIDVLWEASVDVRKASHVMAVLYTTGLTVGTAVFDIYTSHDNDTWTDLETLRDATGTDGDSIWSSVAHSADGTTTIMFPPDGCYHFLKFRVTTEPTNPSDGRHRVFLTATE